MNGVSLAVLLSFASAGCYAMAAVTQEQVAARLPSWSASLTAVRRGRWWLAVGLNVAGGVLHVGALRYGPLTVVQPLGALTLVLSLPLAAVTVGRRVSAHEWWGALATVVGLVGLLSLTAAAVPADSLSTAQVVIVAIVATAVVTALTVAGTRLHSSVLRGLCFAAASGIAFGVASALTQTVVVAAMGGSLTSVGIGAAVVVAGLATAGLLLSQTSYRSGLGAPLATATIANPVAASAIGLALLGERYNAGLLGGVVAVAMAAVAGYGVALLARSSPAAPEAAVRRHRRILHRRH